jgi:hypothetical protein
MNTRKANRQNKKFEELFWAYIFLFYILALLDSFDLETTDFKKPESGMHFKDVQPRG